MKIRTQQEASKLCEEVDTYLHNLSKETKCNGISITYTIAVGVKIGEDTFTHSKANNFCKGTTYKEVVKEEIEYLEKHIEVRKSLLPETLFQKAKRLLTKTYTFRLK